MNKVKPATVVPFSDGGRQFWYNYKERLHDMRGWCGNCDSTVLDVPAM